VPPAQITIRTGACGGPSPGVACPAMRRLPLGPATAIVGLYFVGTGLSIVLAPHTFYDRIAPWGGFNGHDLRDIATFYAAVGVGLLAAVPRPGWRAPLLGVAALQCALHAINHWADLDAVRRGSSAGWFDAVSLTVLTVVIAKLALLARRAGPRRELAA